MLGRGLTEFERPDHTLRISRKKITGTTVEILQQDLFNEPELSLYADKPNMKASLASKQLGFFQAAKHEFVYILSKKDMKQYNPSPQDISDLVGLD